MDTQEAPTFDGGFPHRWTAEILPNRPMILPNRHYVYPGAAEEVEKGALEVLIQPRSDGDALPPFLATCALGFRDPATPTGIWSMPHPDWLCAAAGGYVYLVNVFEPLQFTMLRYRPVLDIVPYRESSSERLQSMYSDAQSISHDAQSAWDDVQSRSVAAQSTAGFLLFVGHHTILAWGREGEAWESDRLSWEGVTVDRIEDGKLFGSGWDLMTDKDLPFALDLATGKRI
jgi:hypothetical protein